MNVPSPAAPARGAEACVRATVEGLGYELVQLERAGARNGLLRVYIDRVPGQRYETGESEFVLVEDCEKVTRQLQLALEVDGIDYARLEVSSPGLDRPLLRESDYRRFAGQAVELTLKVPFQGRKAWRGTLLAEPEGGFALHVVEGSKGKEVEQRLGFTLDEVRSARLVPVLDFKGRRAAKPADDGGKER